MEDHHRETNDNTSIVDTTSTSHPAADSPFRNLVRRCLEWNFEVSRHLCHGTYARTSSSAMLVPGEDCDSNTNSFTGGGSSSTEDHGSDNVDDDEDHHDRDGRSKTTQKPRDRDNTSDAHGTTPDTNHERP